MADAGSVLAGIGSSLGNAVAISSVTVETQFTPPYTYTPAASGGAPAASSSGGGIGGFFAGLLDPLSLVKPQFTIQLASGGPAIVVAPYGPPAQNYLPYLGALLALGVAGGSQLAGQKKIRNGALYAAAALAALGYLNNQGAGS